MMKGIQFLLIIYLILNIQVLQTKSRPGYVGCYRSNDTFSDIKLMESSKYNNGVNCVHICRSSQYLYAATKSYECYCADTPQVYPRRDKCKTPCPVYTTEMCGGLYGLSVYDVIGITEAAEDEYGSFTYPKCVKTYIFLDILSGNRHAAQYVFKNNTGIFCAMQCKKSSFRFAGTKNRFCFCAENIRKDVERGTCDYKCPGDEDEVCGGTDEVSLHDTGFRKTEPTAGEVTTEQLTNSSRALSKITTQVTTETQTASAITEISHGSSIASRSETLSSETGGTSESTLTAVYITIPVVILVSVSMALIVFIIIRRRRLHDATSDCGHTPNQGSVNTVNPDLALGNMLGENGRNNPNNYAATSNHGEYCDLTFEDNNTLTDREYASLDTTCSDYSEAYHNYEQLKIQPVQTAKNSDYASLVLDSKNPNKDTTNTVYANT